MEVTPQYLAGFFDGEGCISIYTCRRANSRVRIKIRLFVTNTHLPTLVAIRAAFGGKLGPHVRGERSRDKRLKLAAGQPVPWRQTWEIIWDNQEQIISLLHTMRPHMLTKAAQVDLVLSEYLPTMKGQKGAYHLSDVEYDKRWEVKRAMELIRKIEYPATTPIN